MHCQVILQLTLSPQVVYSDLKGISSDFEGVLELMTLEQRLFRSIYLNIEERSFVFRDNQLSFKVIGPIVSLWIKGLRSLNAS